MSYRRGSASRWAVVVAALFCALCMVQQRFIGADGLAYREVISSDGEAYYAHLIGLFIQQDLADLQAKEHLFAPVGNDRVIKAFSGAAIVQMPFFLVAHVVASCTPWPMDGLSLPYQIAIGACGYCCFVFGLIRIRRLLLSLEIGDAPVAFTLTALVFATGLLYYTVITPSMSHVHAFAAIAGIFDSARRAWLDTSRGALLESAFFIGLAAIIRPTDLIALLALPAVALGSGLQLWKWIRKQGYGRWIVAVGTLCLILSVQSLFWYAQCGEFLVRPYSQEGFLWGRPMLWSVLFGARKGLFFYWPLLLLAFPGLVFLLHRSWRVGASILVALCSIVYVTGCWWIWYYAWSYGMRPLIDVLVVFSLPIAHFANIAWNNWRWHLAIISAPLVFLQLFQTWQYHMGIIHPYAMDREKYTTIFLRSDDAARGLFGGANQVQPYAPNGYDTLVETRHGRDAFTSAWRTHLRSDGNLLLDPSFSNTPEVSLHSLQLPAARLLHVDVSIRRKALIRGAASSVVVVCSLGTEERARIDISWPLDEIPQSDDRAWRHWNHAFLVPPALAGEMMTVFVRQAGEHPILLNDMQVRVIAPR